MNRQIDEWSLYHSVHAKNTVKDDEGEILYKINCGMCNGQNEITKLHLRECFDLGHEPVCYECMNGRGSDPEEFEER